MVNVTSLLIKAGSGVGFSFGVRAWTEMEIQCVKGMYRLKVVSSEKSLVSFRVLTSIHSNSMSTTSSVFLVLEKYFFPELPPPTWPRYEATLELELPGHVMVVAALTVNPAFKNQVTCPMMSYFITTGLSVHRNEGC